MSREKELTDIEAELKKYYSDANIQKRLKEGAEESIIFGCEAEKINNKYSHKNICDYIGNKHLIENKPFKVDNKEYVGKLLSYIESGVLTGYIIEGFHEYIIIEVDTEEYLFFIRQEFSKIDLSGYDNNYKYKKPYVINEDDLCDSYGSLGRW